MQKIRYIFLIEDDHEDILILKEALKDVNTNIHFDYAYNYDLAIGKLLNSIVQPDIILLDYNLPLLNGRECLQQLKELDKLKDIPVAFFTTSDCPKTKAEMIRLGAADFYTKPVLYKDLVKFLTDLTAGKLINIRFE